MKDKNKFAGHTSSQTIKDIYLASLGDDYGEFILGKNTTIIFYEVPKLLLFVLSRHKFVSKMFSGYNNVLEIGCQEGFGSFIVSQTVMNLHSIDFYIPYIDSCRKRIKSSNIKFEEHDILDNSVPGQFDGAFALDVLEHIEKNDEDTFMQNIISSLSDSGTLILGMPNLDSQKYASDASRIGHVNCKTGDEFAKFGKKYFKNVFSFSMNDEVLHTGFFPMSQYIFILCCTKL